MGQHFGKQGQFWLLSVGALVAASEARLGRYRCPLNPSLSSAGAACQVSDNDLNRAEPESSTECYGVMYFDINNYHLVRHQLESPREEDRRG